MWRFLSMLLLVPLVLVVPSTARAADDDDPKLQGKKLSEWIEQLRGDKAPATRKTMLFALGCPASSPAVWTPWETKQRDIGLLAVSLFDPKKTPIILPAIITALRNDPDDNLRFKAAQALGRLGGKVHDEQKEKGNEDIRLGPVCEGLMASLRGDKVAKVREAAARALGQLKEDGRDGVPVLVTALQDKSEAIQAAAAESLRMLGDTLAVHDALPQLEEALKNPMTGTLARVQLALTMGVLGRKNTIDTKVLREVLKADKTPVDLRVAIVETLGKLGTYNPKIDAVGDITAVLGEKDLSGELRYACVVALDNFGPDAKPAPVELRKCMIQDKNKYVRTTAMHAIGGIGKYLGAESRDVVAELLTTCNDPIYELRVAAIETLGNLGADAIGDDLKKVLAKLDELNKDSQRGIREAAMNSLKKLKPTAP